MKTVLYVLVLAVSMSAAGFAGAGDSLSGKRLFFTPAQRHQLEAEKVVAHSFAIGVDNSATVEASTDVIKVVDSTAPLSIVTRKAVTFDGIVIRHTESEVATSVVWINGEPQHPDTWIKDTVKGYQHKVHRYGQSLYIKPGHTRSVDVTELDKAR